MASKACATCSIASVNVTAGARRLGDRMFSRAWSTSVVSGMGAGLLHVHPGGPRVLPPHLAQTIRGHGPVAATDSPSGAGVGWPGAGSGDGWGSSSGGASYALRTVSSRPVPYSCPSYALTAATRTMLTTTSSDHDPSLAAWTNVHTDSCDGYCQARSNVAAFSASQRKKPMRTKESASGIA